LVYPPEILDQLEQLSAEDWSGEVFRHMFAGVPPDRENTLGARWNPREVAAIYTSLGRETAFAEAEYRISLEPFRPRAERTLYRLKVRLHSVLDLTSRSFLSDLGIDEEVLSGLDLKRCQQVGGAVSWLRHDGLLVPSARHEGANLVIFPANQQPAAEFEVLESETVEDFISED
jgi:RES domain-containing protein